MVDGIIIGTEARELDNEGGTDCQNVGEQFSYELYCVYSGGRISFGNKEDEDISDVDSYCLIEAYGTSQSLTDICIETYYELSDEEIQHLNEIDWQEFDGSIFWMMGKTEENVSNQIEQHNIPGAKPAQHIMKENGEHENYNHNKSYTIVPTDTHERLMSLHKNALRQM